MKDKTYKPGQEVPKSGQYGVYGPKGGYQGHEVTATKGEPFCPTQKPGQQFKLHDPTKHK
ncbi:MAG: hypothetical protein AB7P76_01110 [Candidatus Melainabacteria bacterium]